MYNAAATIARCLESVRAQTKPPARIVVVDDASSDHSIEVAREAGLPNVELISAANNGGPGAARNRGAALAVTDWVAFLDADNTWEPAFLEEVCAAIADFDADFGSSGGTRHLRYPRPRSVNRTLERGPSRADRSADFWKISLRFMPVVPSSLVVRRSLFERVGGFPEDVRTGEDITLVARLWLHGRFCFVNRPVYTSVQLGSGVSAGPRTYHDVRKLLARVGLTLWRSARSRRAGTLWFALAYGRMFVGRHASFLSRLACGPRGPPVAGSETA